MARLGALVALGVAVGAGAKSENKKSTRTKGRTIGEIVGSARSATATEKGKQEDGKHALCFAGADDAPFRNMTFLPPPITGTTQPSEAALAARDAWRRLEETLCKTTPCWARTAPHPFGFGSHLSSLTLGALELMRDQRFPSVPLHGELMGPNRHAALVATARTSRASRQALTIYEASPDCRGGNASQSCWFRAFAGGACRRAAEPCCPAPPGAETCYHGRGWHPRNFRNVPRGETTVGRLTSAAVRKSSRERQQGGRFWAAAAAYAAFSRPQPALERALRAEYASMELDKAPRPWLGAHLRYGDSCGARGKRTGRVCAAAEDYARVAHDMIRAYGYRSVVVATDTDAALDSFTNELKRLAPAVKVYARHDARVDPKIYKKVKRMEKLFVTEDNGRAPPVVEPWAEYYGFAVDLLALADCDGFLGKFTSNLARAAYALMAHRRRCLVPYVSLDSPFCFGGRGFSRDSRKDRTHVVNGELMGDFNCGCADCLRGPLPRPHR